MNNFLYIKRRCPKCLKEFYPGDCQIVSGINGNVLKDAPKGAKQHLSRIKPEPLTGKYVLDLAYRRCPNPQCGYQLPSNIESVENINIAIIGDVSAGKTHFIAVLIHLIQQGLFHKADSFAALNCLTKNVEAEYNRDVIRPLFQDRQSPPKTRMATEIPAPLIYQLNISPTPRHPERRVNLILWDAAGEDFVERERLVLFTPYVLNADAIIFLADPMSMDSIHEALPPFLQRRQVLRKSAEVLSTAVELIRSYRGAGKMSIPIAITLAKSDLLKHMTTLEKPYYFLQRPVYNGTLNLRDWDMVDQEVRKLLFDYNENMLVMTTGNFTKVRFFAVSATGYTPDRNNIYPAIEPCRCLDPLLWLLYELDILHIV